MEPLKNRFTERQRQFFSNLSNYIGEDIYFYGSVMRFDYIKGKSDIDICIFTNNVSSTLHKLSVFLNIPRQQFKKIILKIENKVVHGSKTAFENTEDDIDVEISVFDETYKEQVLMDNERNIPIYKLVILYIIKICYYVLDIISGENYKQLKRFIMNDNEKKFIVMDNFIE